MGALGDYLRGGCGDGLAVRDSEEGCGVWGGCFGIDGFHWPVPAGYGGIHPLFRLFPARIRRYFGDGPACASQHIRMGRTDFQCRCIRPVRPLSFGASVLDEAAQGRAPDRICDPGRPGTLARNRESATGPRGGVFRVDGFGDEYAWGVWRGEFGGDGEEIPGQARNEEEGARNEGKRDSFASLGMTRRVSNDK